MITVAELDRRILELSTSRDQLQQMLEQTRANLSAHLGAIEELTRWRDRIAAEQKPARVEQPGE